MQNIRTFGQKFLSITKLLDALSSLGGLRGQLGAQPAQPGRPERDLGALAGSIWPRLARSGCSERPGSLDLAVLVALGRSGWLDLAALGVDFAAHGQCFR